MDFSQFEELVKTRQSCRNFSDKPLPAEEVEKIAETAVLAPSACNSQPWKLYCVTSKEKVEEVCAALTHGGRNAFLSGAKAFIAAAEKGAVLKPDVAKVFSEKRFVKYDVGEVIAYATLAAKSRGVESCIIGWMNTEKLRSALGMSEDEDCAVVIALGYSDIPIREKSRKSAEETIKFI